MGITFEIPPGIPGPKPLEQKIAEYEADRQYTYGPRAPATHVPERAGPDKVLRDQLTLANAKLAETQRTIAEQQVMIRELIQQLAEAQQTILDLEFQSHLDNLK